MPLAHLILLLALVIIAASLSVWVGLVVAGTATLPGWTAIAALASIALVVRLIFARDA